MCTLLHPHDTCVWGDILRGLGTIVVTFKPFGVASQKGSEGINHLHHIPHSEIAFLTFWLLSSPIPFAMSWSSQPLSIWILQCLKLMTIWSDVSWNSTMMAEVLSSRTSLWLWERFPFTLRFDHWLVRRLS